MNYIIVDKQNNIKQNGMKSYQYGNMDIYVDGLIYVYGKKAGKESIDWLAEIVKHKGYIPFEDLRGAYSCIIRVDNLTTAFSDNSSMHCLYYTDKMVSNSFLKTVEQELNIGKTLQFDEEAICEYLTIGNVFFEKTFLKDIHILHSEDLITITDQTLTLSKKNVGDIDERSTLTSISDFFDKVAYSLSDMQVCQALTGGYDSRLIYACLSNRIKDNPAISANDPNNKDVKYASEVANANNDTLDIINVKKPTFNENFINDLFILKDGMEPFDIDADVRLLTFNSRLAQKHNILITGDGGVLHKDWEWTQDFPLYKKKRSNAKQFYKQRLYYIRIDNHIGENLKKAFDEQSNRFIDELNSIVKSINTQSYDSWYFWVSGNRRTELNCNPIEGIISYAPLQEMDIVRYSYALPRWKRFFFNSIRETMTKENKKIARIKTNYGTNASCEATYVIADIFFQTIEYCRKVFRFLGRKIIHKNVLSKSILNWTLETEIRESKSAVEAVEYARRNGYINTSLHIDELSYAEVQRLVHIYCLYCFMTQQMK